MAMTDRQPNPGYHDHPFTEALRIIQEAFRAGLMAAAADSKLDRVLAEIHQLRQEIHTMSGTISEQLDAATALAVENQAKMGTALADLGADVAELIRLVGEGTGPAGSTITQVQADAATAASAAGTALADQLTALAAQFPAPPPPPVVV